MYGLNKYAEKIKTVNIAHGFTGVPAAINNTEDSIHMIYALALIGTEVTEKCDLRSLHNYCSLLSQFKDMMVMYVAKNTNKLWSSDVLMQMYNMFRKHKKRYCSPQLFLFN